MKGDFYHYYNRGCNKQPIFFNEENYQYLLKKIKQSYQKYSIQIIAYCLMPNHYHFLLQQLSDRNVSDWIKSLFIGYVQAVNIQQNRSGTLFEGRAQHILIDKEEYLLQIVRYIHYNPVKAGLVNSADGWLYSNYLEWIGKRAGTMFDRKFFCTYFKDHEDYRDFVERYGIEESEIEKIKDYLFDEGI